MSAEKTAFSVMRAKLCEKELYLCFTKQRNMRYYTWLKNLENLDYPKRTRLLFSELRAKNRGMETFNAIRNSEGSLSESQEECLLYWSQYCQNLYRGQKNSKFIYVPFEDKKLDSPIEFTEFVTAVISLKSNKAPGADFITNEDIKLFLPQASEEIESLDSSEMVLNMMFNLVEVFWEFEKIPLDLKRVILRPFLKKRDSDEFDPNNYRTISLLNSFFKLYEAIIHRRLMNKLESELLISSVQAAYRPRKSTADHIFVLQELFFDIALTNSVSVEVVSKNHSIYVLRI